MKIYIAGPMQGIPYFNFPAFMEAQDTLEQLGHLVFNPAENDNDTFGVDISADNPTGSKEQAELEHGFDLRNALSVDLSWITEHADAVYLLPGWSKSKGAVAERAAMEAVGGQVIYAVGAEMIPSVAWSTEIEARDMGSYQIGRHPAL